jgi:hypothetical protein
MKHTPGPWYDSSTSNHQGLIIAENTGENIAVAYDKKNAKILAASPVMFEACEHIEWDLTRALHQDMKVSEFIKKECFKNLKSAISEATE